MNRAIATPTYRVLPYVTMAQAGGDARHEKGNAFAGKAKGR